MGGTKKRLDSAEEKTSELGEMEIVTLQSEVQMIKQREKNAQSLRDLWNNIK